MNVKEKVILVGDSIDSGVNEKGFSTDKFSIIARDVLGATSNDMAYHIINFTEKHKKTNCP